MWCKKRVGMEGGKWRRNEWFLPFMSGCHLSKFFLKFETTHNSFSIIILQMRKAFCPNKKNTKH